MFKKILIGLVLIVIVCAIVIAVQPSEFRIARSTTIAAPPAEVFPHVNEFHNWEAWSPWAKLDPAVKNTFEGPPAGTGAIFKWNGNSDVGEGMMTITESRPNDQVKIKLDFVRPFQDTSNVEFGFQPKGNDTEVTWVMHGQSGFISKAFFLFVDMDKKLGGDFDKGLAKMKSVVEAKTPKQSDTKE